MVRTHIHKIRLLPLEVPAISLQGCNEVGEQLLRPAAGTAHSLSAMGTILTVSKECARADAG